MQINANQWESMEISQCKSMIINGIIGNHWESLIKLNGNQWKSMKTNAIQWESIEFDENQGNSMTFNDNQ